MNYPTYDDCLYFVDQQSPASSDDQKILFAKELQKICIRENETIERAWLLEEYWQ